MLSIYHTGTLASALNHVLRLRDVSYDTAVDVGAHTLQYVTDNIDTHFCSHIR